MLWIHIAGITILLSLFSYGNWFKNPIPLDEMYGYLAYELHWLIGAEWSKYASVPQTNIASDNGLSPDRRQAIIWTNAGILSIRK